MDLVYLFVQFSKVVLILICLPKKTVLAIHSSVKVESPVIFEFNEFENNF